MNYTIDVGVLRVHGEEAAKFLHAIVSSDVLVLHVGDTQESLLLEPTGKVISVMWIHRSLESEYLIVGNAQHIDTTYASLKKFLIRTKAEIENVSDQYSAYVSDNAKGAVIAGYLGDDSLYVALVEHSSNSDDAEHEDLRISRGAVSQSDVGGIIPQEAHLDKHAVSFTKGCYLGQELVCRIDSREASTPYTFFAVELTGGVGVGDVLTVRNEVVGSITSANGRIAIAKISRKGTQQLDSDSVRVGDVRSQAMALTKGYFSL